MQVNNMSSQNFGMSLQITKEALEPLQKKSIEYLKKVDKAGDDLKLTKNYHVLIGDKELTPVITSPYANKYKPPFTPKKLRDGQDYLEIPTTWNGTEIYGLKKDKPYTIYLQYESKEAALEAYKKISSKNSDLERAVELTKELDKRDLERIAKETAERAEKKEAENMANNVFSKYGVTE